MNKKGRPLAKEEKKECRISAYLTKTEKKEFDIAFKKSGWESVAKFIKKATMGSGIQVKTPYTDADLYNEMQRNITDIHKLCVNVNQIAKKINSIKTDVSISVLEYELRHLSELIIEIKNEEKIMKSQSQIIVKEFFK